MDCGGGGTIWNTINGGQNWIQQVSGSTENLYGVFTNNATDCWAVGWNGTIIHTGNGGIYYPIVKLVTNTSTTYLGNEVQFNATITNEVGNCSDFWNWGDGTNTTDTALVNYEANGTYCTDNFVDHEYLNPGNYLVTLITMDANGQSGSAQMTIMILTTTLNLTINAYEYLSPNNVPSHLRELLMSAMISSLMFRS